LREEMLSPLFIPILVAECLLSWLGGVAVAWLLGMVAASATKKVNYFKPNTLRKGISHGVSKIIYVLF
jgi:hypothetical protein